MNIRIVFITILISFFSKSSMAQEKKEEVPMLPSVRALALVSNDTTYIRWAVDQPVAWKRANDYGYTIERFTVSRDGNPLETPEKKVLTKTPILPAPIAAWEKAVHTNDYAAILAQALYGETFEIEGSEPGSLLQIVNKAKELEQRFSFALIAADMNFKAAQLAGLGYIDTQISTNEKYLYRIKVAIPKEASTIIKQGSVVVDAMHPQTLPKPIELTAVSGDKSIILTWEYQTYKSIFTSYYLERSSDGTSFSRLGDTPLVNLNDKPEKPARNMTYIDTIPKNGVSYYYRVKGISPFGKTSPPSDIIEAQGIKKLEITPHLKHTGINANNKVVLQWEFPKEAESQLSSFQLQWAAEAKGPYKTIKENIEVQQRELLYPLEEPSNYFTITAQGKNNDKRTSLPIFIQTIDTMPPKAPIALQGILDTTGVVQISWQANLENDLLGYRVFRGNKKGEELTQLTIDPVQKNSFTDTVNIISLNTKVFYSVVAVDKRFNMSAYSEVLELQKPDKIPPASPVFAQYKVEPKGVFLSWVNSSSTDVIKHILYRQNVTAQEEWEMLFETDTLTSYIDAKAKTATKYRYAIFAEDHTGLVSAPSSPISLTVVNMTPVESIKGLQAIANTEDKSITLSWKVANDKVQEIAIYKSKKDGKPKLLRQVLATISNLEDNQVHPSTTYTYYLKPIMENGSFSKFLTIDVNY